MVPCYSMQSWRHFPVDFLLRLRGGVEYCVLEMCIKTIIICLVMGSYLMDGDDNTLGESLPSISPMTPSSVLLFLQSHMMPSSRPSPGAFGIVVWNAGPEL